MRLLALSLCLAGLLSGCLRLETTIKEHKSVTSPDGKVVARAVFADSGAVSSHDQLVLLTPPGWTYRKDMDLLPFRVASIQRVSDADIDLVWSDSKTLTIRFTQYGDGQVSYRSSHEGIDVFIEHHRKK